MSVGLVLHLSWATSFPPAFRDAPSEYACFQAALFSHYSLHYSHYFVQRKLFTIHHCAQNQLCTKPEALNTVYSVHCVHSVHCVQIVHCTLCSLCVDCIPELTLWLLLQLPQVTTRIAPHLTLLLLCHLQFTQIAQAPAQQLTELSSV